MDRIGFHKGHGTHNDFILLSDPEGLRPLTPEFVQAVADRRSGFGADGVIRAVRAGASGEELDGDGSLWFMDYYNADGSIAEMCGNGLRVFARFLMQEQLIDTDEFDVVTRAGIKHVVAGARDVATTIGPAEVASDRAWVSVGEHGYEAVPVDVGNPHAVSFVTPADLESLDLHDMPTWEPADRFPDGVNLEFVAVKSADELTMRVYERGVGETMSCGTGVVAAAAAHRSLHPGEEAVTVHVPGGTLHVEFGDDGATLTGPAVIVGDGHFWF